MTSQMVWAGDVGGTAVVRPISSAVISKIIPIGTSVMLGDGLKKGKAKHINHFAANYIIAHAIKPGSADELLASHNEMIKSTGNQACFIVYYCVFFCIFTGSHFNVSLHSVTAAQRCQSLPIVAEDLRFLYCLSLIFLHIDKIPQRSPTF